MRKVSNKKDGKNRNRTKEKTNRQYLKEILKNIENIQHSILKKLDRTSKPDEEHTIALTTYRQISKPLQVTSYKNIKSNYANSKESTPKNHSKRCPQSKKCPQNSFAVDTYSPNIPKCSSNFYSGNKYNSSKSHNEKAKTENFAQYFTVRCKQKPAHLDKTNPFRSITERAGKQECNKSQRKILSAKQIQLIQKLQNKTQNSIILQSPKPRLQNEIQAFYKNEIRKLEVQQKIKQLQSQLQNCLSNKKVANLSQFHYIRSRMKRISLQINELKQKRYSMKR